MFKNLFSICFFSCVLSCAHTDSGDMSNNQVFKAPKDKVWEAMVAVLRKYPLKTIDEQKGYIETEILKADQFWKAPHQIDDNFSGYSSYLTVKMDYKKPYVHVIIYKKVYKQKGFISSKQEVPSDLLEENILLYRIARELKIKSFLDRM